MRFFKLLRFLVRRKLFYLVRNSWPVWFYVLNREPRRLYRKHSFRSDPVRERILGELRESGLALTSLEELFPGTNFLLELNSYAAPLREKAEVKTKKVFLKNLFERVPPLDLKNPYVRLALEKKILEIVAGYLRMFPKFRGFTLNLTTPMIEGEAPRDSQRWHRDPEDKIVLKMFLYLTEVDETAGPFIYLKGSHHLGKYKNFFPTAPPAGSYPLLGAVENKISPEEIKICPGRAGSVIFCETSGLHKGGYARLKERLMFTAIYASRAATSPKVYYHPEGFKDVSISLTPLQEYAVKN